MIEYECNIEEGKKLLFDFWNSELIVTSDGGVLSKGDAIDLAKRILLYHGIGCPEDSNGGDVVGDDKSQ